MNTEQPTPETDAQISDDWSGGAEAVSVDFARSLERKLNEARAELTAMSEVIKEAHAALLQISECRVFYEDSMDINSNATNAGLVALAKLEPFTVRDKPKVQDTFEAHGLTWIKHIPGDPMPCYGRTKVRVLYGREKEGEYRNFVDEARSWNWSNDLPEDFQTIGWNYAEPHEY